ncbi:MAG: hypothetical protein QUV05_14880 [Phycisphaerae bacterium]|nr:hypothetical protein [Phycisphaerae bacterium]
MSETWVVNASPVIALARIGQLRFLEELASLLLLPEAVAAEILAGPDDDSARIAVLCPRPPPSLPTCEAPVSTSTTRWFV